MSVLYHGTRRGFRPGGLVLPCGETGDCAWEGFPHDSDAVYLTDKFEVAVFFAHHGIGRGRPKVLTVSPSAEPIAVAFQLAGSWRWEYKVPWATVTAVQMLTEDDLVWTRREVSV